MSKFKQVLMFIIISSFSMSSRSEQIDYNLQALQDPVFLENSRQFSNQAIEHKPLLGEILNQLDLDYLYELDQNKIYRIDEQSLDVSILNSETSSISIPTILNFFANINANSSNILGEASTSVTCFTGGAVAEVSGFMSAQDRRDPVQGEGSKIGTLVIDTSVLSKEEVRFSFVKESGGALRNKTVMQTLHTGSCNGVTEIKSHIHHWPKLKLSLVIDDTGSMSEELGGVKSAVIDHVNTRISDPESIERGISYELISFKDSPTLRLSNTDDGNAVINSVNTLSASGGGDCPEDSTGALNLALNRLTGDEDSEGEIILVTDASPRSGGIDGIITQAQNLGVNVNVLLTGDCVASSASVTIARTKSLSTAAITSSVLSARDVFKRIANETGGLYFYRPGGTVNDYKDILAEMIGAAETGGDTVPPSVSVNTSPTILWPPNHEMIAIEVSVSAVDDNDPSPVVELVSVTTTDPDDGQGDGNTTEDIQISPEGQIFLRAERSGLDNDRFYTITYQATDSSGNVGFGSADVLVPHNQ